MDLHHNKQTALVHIKQSKTDHYALGQSVTIHAGKNLTYCPLACLQEWLALSGIKSGFLFPAVINHHVYERPISGATFAKIIKDLCKKSGLNEKDFAGHSLRRGLLTSAIEAGSDINDLRVHARHTQSSTTEYYIGQSAHKPKNPSKGLL